MLFVGLLPNQYLYGKVNPYLDTITLFNNIVHKRTCDDLTKILVYGTEVERDDIVILALLQILSKKHKDFSKFKTTTHTRTQDARTYLHGEHYVYIIIDLFVLS